MKYIEMDIDTTVQGIDLVTTELMKLGITDIVIDDPRDVDFLLDKENDYEWDYVDDKVLELKNVKPKITVYLEDTRENRNQIENVNSALADLLEKNKNGQFGEILDLGTLSMNSSMEDDADWKDNWKEFFKPAKISKKFVVKPTWEEYEKTDNELVLEIDPGMAFGTGTHETTSLCVNLMEDYMKESDKILDVGCGSGILAIAGAMLGSREVLGVEIDPVAVEIAEENIRLNNVEDKAKAQYGDLTKGIDFKANVVVANLMADLVMMLSKDVAKHLLEGGYYISSGILVEKEEIVARAIRECGFEIVEIREDGMWCAIVAKLK